MKNERIYQFIANCVALALGIFLLQNGASNGSGALMVMGAFLIAFSIPMMMKCAMRRHSA